MLEYQQKISSLTDWSDYLKSWIAEGEGRQSVGEGPRLAWCPGRMAEARHCDSAKRGRRQSHRPSIGLPTVVVRLEGGAAEGHHKGTARQRSRDLPPQGQTRGAAETRRATSRVEVGGGQRRWVLERQRVEGGLLGWVYIMFSTFMG